MLADEHGCVVAHLLLSLCVKLQRLDEPDDREMALCRRRTPSFMFASSPPQHERYMRRCIELACKALETRDTPVGSLVVREGEIIGEGIEAVDRPG